MIEKKELIIVGSPRCPGCVRLKRSLENDEVKFAYLDIYSKDSAIQAQAREYATKAKSNRLPIVFYGGEELSPVDTLEFINNKGPLAQLVRVADS